MVSGPSANTQPPAYQTGDGIRRKPEHREHVGTRIAAIRRERGLTQEALAERAGVSHETVRKLEQQKRTPSLAILGSLAGALDVSPGRLIDPEGLPDRKQERPSDYLSSGVILSPDFVAACNNRDLGSVFNIAVNAGYPVSHLARRCEMTVSQVGDYMKGRTQAQAVRIFCCVSDGLHIPGDMMGVGRRPWESGGADSTGVPVYATSDSASSGFSPEESARFPLIAGTRGWPKIDELSDEELMRRRTFLLNAALFTGLGAASATAMEAIRHELNLSFAEERATADTDEWHEIATEYGESYLSTAPPELINPLMTDMVGLQAALQRHAGTARKQELLSVAALLSAFTAQTLANMGQDHEARRWWRTARNAADRSGDPYSSLWVRGREITRAMENRPVPAILSLIEEAEGFVDQGPPEAVLELLGGKAQTLALAGRDREADQTLLQLRECFSRLPAEYNGSLLGWGLERLYNTESFVYSRLGDLKKAEAARLSGLALYDGTNVRWPAGLELNLAFCLVSIGDVAEGLNHARTVITGLPEVHRTKPIITDGYKLLSAVLPRERQLPMVTEYRDWVSELLSSSTAQVNHSN